MSHNIVDKGKVVRENTQVLCIAWLCLRYWNEVTLSSDHMNHFCVSLLAFSQQRHLFAHSTAGVFPQIKDISLSQTCSYNSGTLNDGFEYMQNPLRHEIFRVSPTKYICILAVL